MSECKKLCSLIEESEGGEEEGGAGEWHRLVPTETRGSIIAFLSGKSTNLEVGGACCSGNYLLFSVVLTMVVMAAM